LSIKKLILIGASTGGPGQLQKIIKTINKDFDATIVIIQHMQSPYLSSFVKQLNNNCNLDVSLSKENLVLKNRTIYVLEENYEIKDKNGDLVFHRYNKPLNYSPNIDLLFNSVASINKNIKIMAIILTGIGNDGASGASNLAKIGATCINENEQSSIVYGMPKAASELNPNALQLGIEEICYKIGEF